MAIDDQYKQFGALNVALVDKDEASAQNSRMLLSSLGIYQIHMVKNYDELMDVMVETPVDLIAFDAGEKTEEDIELIRKLRIESSDIALTPILTLSSDTTLEDVHVIVNAGATELVGKPTNVKTMFSRLQNMVNSPRSFVCTKNFKGPDRRRKQQPGVQSEGRINRSPKIVTREQYLNGNEDGPVIIMPDFKLKAKVSHLSDGVINQTAEDEFIFWALSDVATLESSQYALSEGGSISANLERICNACLSIEARSQAYGYELGCKAARSLSEFCREHFDEDESAHLLVIEKHIQILSNVYHNRLSGDGGDQGQALLHDLGLLVKKYVLL